MAASPRRLRLGRLVGRPKGPAHRRDVMLISAFPLPKSGTYAPKVNGLYQYLDGKMREVIAATTSPCAAVSAVIDEQLRALGFNTLSVLFSVLAESMGLAAMGGVLGGLAVTAMGVSPADARSSIRISLGLQTSEADSQLILGDDRERGAEALGDVLPRRTGPQRRTGTTRRAPAAAGPPVPQAGRTPAADSGSPHPASASSSHGRSAVGR